MTVRQQILILIGLALLGTVIGSTLRAVNAQTWFVGGPPSR